MIKEVVRVGLVIVGVARTLHLIIGNENKENNEKEIRNKNNEIKEIRKYLRRKIGHTKNISPKHCLLNYFHNSFLVRLQIPLFSEQDNFLLKRGLRIIF